MEFEYKYPITLEESARIQDVFNSYSKSVFDGGGVIFTSFFLLITLALFYLLLSDVFGVLLILISPPLLLYLAFFAPFHQADEARKELVSAASPAIEDDRRYIAFQESTSRFLAENNIDLAENCAIESEDEEFNDAISDVVDDSKEEGVLYLGPTLPSITPRDTILCTNKNNPVMTKNLKLIDKDGEERLVDSTFSANKENDYLTFSIEDSL